jgi:hypothetical protein
VFKAQKSPAAGKAFMRYKRQNFISSLGDYSLE